jgi:hypothetical protein
MAPFLAGRASGGYRAPRRSRKMTPAPGRMPPGAGSGGVHWTPDRPDGSGRPIAPPQLRPPLAGRPLPDPGDQRSKRGPAKPPRTAQASGPKGRVTNSATSPHRLPGWAEGRRGRARLPHRLAGLPRVFRSGAPPFMPHRTGQLPLKRRPGCVPLGGGWHGGRDLGSTARTRNQLEAFVGLPLRPRFPFGSEGRGKPAAPTKRPTCDDQVVAGGAVLPAASQHLPGHPLLLPPIPTKASGRFDALPAWGQPGALKAYPNNGDRHVSMRACPRFSDRLLAGNAGTA